MQGGGEVEISGSPTEKAILSWGVKVVCLHYTGEFLIMPLFPVVSCIGLKCAAWYEL